MLGLLTASAFFIRLENFKNSKTRSIDEVVYYRMAKQVLDEGPSGYNTLPYGRELAATGRPLPDYFFQPVFKHPPLFTFLTALSMKIFGIRGSSAAYIPLLFGVFMIPLTYRLGKLVFGEGVGILSSLIMAFDPMTTICSQKLWIETSVGFFVTFSIYWFVRALKSHRDIFFLLSGITSSLGILCKYPGGIATPIICLYALLFEHRLFKKKEFTIGLLLPIFSLFPWVIWNFLIYKMDFLSLQFQLHSDKFHTVVLTKNIILVGLLGVCSFVLVKKIRRGRLELGKNISLHKHKNTVYIITTAFFLPFFLKAILKSLNPYHIPETSWTGSTFYNSPATFYIDRLLEFSLIYLLGFAALFKKTTSPNFSERILKLTIFIILSFYTIWQAYQSRYIMAALPFLIIIGSHLIISLYHQSCNTYSFLIRMALRTSVVFIVLIMFMKLYIVNISVSFPNNMCYF